MIDRRAFLATVGASVLAAPLRGETQQAGKVWRIGVLGPRTRADGSRYNDAFIQGLRELGWVEGKSFVIESRYADGHAERLGDLAAELVRAKVDLIFAGTSATAAAAKAATSSIPIVTATGADAVELGLVASLARPGGNVTGLAWDVSLHTFGKGLELLKECIPAARRIAILFNSGNPSHRVALKDVNARGEALGLALVPLSADNAVEIDRAFAAMTRARADAVLVMADSLFGFHRVRIQQQSERRRLPAMYGLREHAETGGLMSYGPDAFDNFRRAAAYVDKIIKGAKPGDLPMEQPTKFELVINGKTAKALGLTIPQSVLVRADRIIE